MDAHSGSWRFQKHVDFADLAPVLFAIEASIAWDWAREWWAGTVHSGPLQSQGHISHLRHVVFQITGMEYLFSIAFRAILE